MRTKQKDEQTQVQKTLFEPLLDTDLHHYSWIFVLPQCSDLQKPRHVSVSEDQQVIECKSDGVKIQCISEQI